MRLYVTVGGFLLVLAACQPSKPVDNGRNLADSALAVHFERVQNLRHYDTAGFEHQLLMAIYRRDSAYLSAYLGTGSEVVLDRSVTLSMDSSLGLPPLATLDVDEVYRFQTNTGSWSISRPGGPSINMQAMTITRTDSLVQLQALRGFYEGLFAVPGMPCRTTVYERVDTVLTMNAWRKLEDALRYCDFWGLKATNGYFGNDGGYASMEGYIPPQDSRSARHNYLLRWSIRNTALDSPMRLAIRLSGGWTPYY